MNPVLPLRAPSARFLPCPEPASALLFPVSGYPVPEAERKESLQAMISLSRAFAMQGLSSEMFIHIIPSKNPAVGALISPNGRDWMPRPGLGVWPARRPPAMWTKEDFENLEPGRPPQGAVFPTFRISAPGEARERARATIYGTGAVLEVLTRDSGDVLVERGTQLLLPTIQEPAYRSFPFYLPLLDAAALANVPYDKLQAWLCGASVYLRESIDDGGLLLVSLPPVRPVLESLGITPEPLPPGASQVTIN